MANTEKRTKPRKRSPAYPSLSIKEAIAKTKAIYDEEAQHSISPEIALSHWQYEPTSGNGMRAVAALKQFGLLKEIGSRGDRELVLTELAMDIIMPPDDDPNEPLSSIQKAVLAPKIYKELWDRYKDSGLPSDQNLKRVLVREMDFNSTSVPNFSRRFRDSLAFAKLSNSGIIENGEIASDSSSDKGDAAQVFSGVSLDDIFGTFPSSGQKTRNSPKPAQRQGEIKMPTGTKAEVLTLDHGPDFVLQRPVSLTADEFEDFQDWWNIMLRRVKRLVVPPELPASETDSE